MTNMNIRWMATTVTLFLALGAPPLDANGAAGDPSEWGPFSSSISMGGSEGAWGSAAVTSLIEPERAGDSPADNSASAVGETTEIRPRHAIELELARAEVDAAGSREVKLHYLSAAYRRYLKYHEDHKYRIFAGVGVAAYDADSTDLGFNTKLGSEFSLTARHNVSFEVSVAYHRPDSELDFFNVLVGFRVHAKRRGE